MDVLDHPLLLTPPEKLAMPLAWAGHIPFAMLLVELARPRVIVELGTHTGNSYNAFCQAVDALALETRCHAVDTWEGDPHAGQYGPEIYAELREYHELRYARFSRLLKMTFDEAAAQFEPGSVDLLHIDGLHTYEAVRHDFETWLPKMSGRGVVLFHDVNVHQGDFGVWRLWDELKGRYPFLEYPHSHGLGIIAVGKEVPEPLHRLMTMDELRKGTFAALLERLGGNLTHGRNVEALEEALQTRDQEIEALRGMAKSLQAEVVFLDRDHAEVRRQRDAVAEHLKEVLYNERVLAARARLLGNTLDNIQRSTGWKMLAPLRWYGLQRRRAGMVLGAVPALAAEAGGGVALVRNLLHLWRRDGTPGIRTLVKRHLPLAEPAAAGDALERASPRGKVEWGPVSEKPQIVFVSHDATRSGAPMFLLSVIAYVTRKLDAGCIILLASGGDLEAEFRRFGTTIVLGSRDAVDAAIMAELQRRNVRLVYANTITNGALQTCLKALGCPVLCHVHELAFSIEHMFGQRNLNQILATTDVFLAGSQAVARCLEKWVPGDKVFLAYPFINTAANLQTASSAEPPMQLPQGAVVVGACGTIVWRKGPDLFVQMARRVIAATGKPLVFVWLGGPLDQAEYRNLRNDAEILGIEKQLLFPGAVASHLPYFAQFDIFVLPSREDPFPLVVLDAATLGKPVVCFGQAGGAPEFVEDDAGCVVPYLDVEAMAAAVLRLVEDPQMRSALGETARRKALERHDVSVGAEHIARKIGELTAIGRQTI